MEDTATPEISCDLQTAEDSGRKDVIKFTDEWLMKETTKFHVMLMKHTSKPFADLFKATVSSKNNQGQETIKADKLYFKRLLNAVNDGQTKEMLDVQKHELSPVPKCKRCMNILQNRTWPQHPDNSANHSDRSSKF